MRVTAIIYAILSLLAARQVEAKITVQATDLKAIVDTNAKGDKMPYRLWTPDGYSAPKNAMKQYPLVLFLHGQGERGTDNLLQVKKHNGSFELLSDANRQQNPTFFVAPQCAKSTPYGWNTDRRAHLRAIIVKLQSQYRIDPRRLYLTGISMGGNGAWTMAIDVPTLWAATVPMSGWGPASKAAVLKDMPLWAFHAADDKTVDVSGTDKMIDAIKKAGGNPKYSRYVSGGHAIWKQAYADPQLSPWLFGKQLPAAPLVDGGIADAAPSKDAGAGTDTSAPDSGIGDGGVSQDGSATADSGPTDSGGGDAGSAVGEDGGCMIGGQTGPASLALLSLLALWLSRRRR